MATLSRPPICSGSQSMVIENMPVLVQYNFPYTGPFGAQMSEAYRELAESIAKEPGLLWKLWLENPATQQSGGIYLFQDRGSAEAYVAKHTARLEQFGLKDVYVRTSEVNVELSQLTNAGAALQP